MMQPNIAGCEIDAVVRNACRADRAIVIQWDPGADLPEPASLNQIDRGICRRYVMDQPDRAAKSNVLAQRAYVASGGANLNVAVDLSLIGKKFERLPGHLILLFQQ